MIKQQVLILKGCNKIGNLRSIWTVFFFFPEKVYLKFWQNIKIIIIFTI